MSDTTQKQSGDVVDTLPADLQPALSETIYKFPDNSRRRIPATTYLAIGVAIGASRLVGVSVVNGGVLLVGLLLALFGVYGFVAGFRMHTNEKDALIAAQSAVGFPIGHASAQQVWRGVLSRPTWRVLVYSIEEPPHQRALVLVDAISGEVVEHLVEDNPESSVHDA